MGGYWNLCARARVPLIIAAVLLSFPSIAVCQGTTGTAGASWPRIRSQGDVGLGERWLLDQHDLRALGAAATGAFLLVGADEEIRRASQDPSIQGNGALRAIFPAVKPLGDETPFVAALGTHLLGRVLDEPRISDLGLHTAEAVAVAGLAQALVKFTLARGRPGLVGSNAHAFLHDGPFTLENARHSFPSGHTAVAFALAGALSEETAYHWPGKERVVAPITYGAAALVGLSRIYDDKHWASDVLMGAAIGTVVSRAWVRQAHVREGGTWSRVRWLLIPGVGRGAGVGGRISF